MTSIPYIVDLSVIGILILSVLWAAMRGLIREVLSIVAWGGAAVICVVFGHMFIPLARGYVGHDLLAAAAAYGGLFLAVLLPLSYVSFKISDSVRDSPIGWFDRLLGVGFGLARGLFIVGIAYLLFAFLSPSDTQPSWLREARTFPLVKSSSDVIGALLPANLKPKPGTAETPKSARNTPATPARTQPAAEPRAAREEAAAAPPRPSPRPAAEPAREREPAPARPEAARTETPEPAPRRTEASAPTPRPKPELEGPSSGDREGLDGLVQDINRNPTPDGR
jgi:membrane protein required for colicin V production